MRELRDVFHLAIPAHDPDDTMAFYVAGLGCKLARRYPDRLTLDFFGDQVVCHFTEPEPWSGKPLKIYPRHFGVTFREEVDFHSLHHLCQERKLPFFSEMCQRFEGLVEVHSTFVLRDPADNLLEFKHYRDPRMMY